MNEVQKMAEKLRPFASKFGIKIEEVDKIKTEFKSPFDHRFGLDIKKKIVYFEKNDNKFYHQISASLIHEIGHALFDDEHTLHTGTEEFEWFGWEWNLAKKIGVEEEWRTANWNYLVTDRGDEFGRLSKEKQDEILDERTHNARMKGYLKTLEE